MFLISDLLTIHSQLDELFFEHQAALLRFNLAAAFELLDQFELALVKHMEDEEEVLLPAYEALGAFPGAGAPRIFYDDHQKMRSLVSAFKQKTLGLSDGEAPEREMIELLDREAFFKRLCSHHDKRESEYLYPILDRQLTEQERAVLLARVQYRPSIRAAISGE